MPNNDYERGRISFPGIIAPISASYTLSHGTDPGRILLQCNPQKNTVFQNGPFTFQWQNTRLVIPDCRINTDRVSLTADGFLTSVELEDYRWFWRYPVINGWYNVRNAYQSIYAKTKKNPQELAKLLMEKLGVRKEQMNVASLPTDDWPFMEWYSSNAANELSSLAERYGCRVVPWPDGRVNIFKLGEGVPLPPNLPTGTDSMGVIAPAGPDRIEIHFGPTKYRVVSKLEPVGIDVDGSVKLIDDLSYRPTGGWGYGNSTNYETPGHFPKLQEALIAKYGSANSRRGQFAFIMDLARRAIFKWYRIRLKLPSDSTNNQPFKIPGYDGKVSSLAQILPIDDRLQNVSLDPEHPAEIKDGAKDTDIFWDAYDATVVWGEFFKFRTNMLAPVNPDYQWHNKGIGENFYYPGGYSLDRERGIVQFDDYVYSRKESDQTQIFPDLAISFMCSPRDEKTGELKRYIVGRDRTDIVKSGTQPLVVVHPEFQLVVTFDVDSTGRNSPVREVNKKLLDKVGNYYIDAELRKFRKQEPRQKQYNGLWPVYTSGAIREVTFSMNPDSGMETVACYNDERQPYVIPYETRRRNQRVSANLRTNEYAPPVFMTQPQTFPYNLGSSFINASPSRR